MSPLSRSAAVNSLHEPTEIRLVVVYNTEALRNLNSTLLLDEETRPVHNAQRTLDERGF